MANYSRPIAIICGSGASQLLPQQMEQLESVEIDPPYGQTSAPIHVSELHGVTVCILNRHGDDHTIPPHRINYRANLWALAEFGCNLAIAISTVGGIRGDLKSGDLLLPDQIIDYTWGRYSSYFDGELGGGVGHLETAEPYCMALRDLIRNAAENVNVPLSDHGVYACTQGPRFETAAEINRIEKDGGDVVGMTGMPEAALAAENQICYASISLVANPAAGRGGREISVAKMQHSWEKGSENLHKLLDESIRLIASKKPHDMPINSHIMKI